FGRFGPLVNSRFAALSTLRIYCKLLSLYNYPGVSCKKRKALIPSCLNFSHILLFSLLCGTEYRVLVQGRCSREMKGFYRFFHKKRPSSEELGKRPVKLAYKRGSIYYSYYTPAS